MYVLCVLSKTLSLSAESPLGLLPFGLWQCQTDININININVNINIKQFLPFGLWHQHQLWLTQMGKSKWVRGCERGSGRKSLEAQFLWNVSTPVSYLGLLPFPLWIFYHKLSNNSSSVFFWRPLAKRWWFREPIRFLLQARLARMLCVTVI